MSFEKHTEQSSISEDVLQYCDRKGEGKALKRDNLSKRAELLSRIAISFLQLSIRAKLNEYFSKPSQYFSVEIATVNVLYYGGLKSKFSAHRCRATSEDLKNS